jgi:hypothetical protein
MSQEEQTRAQDAAGAPPVDGQIKGFYRANAGRVNVEGFAAGLEQRIRPAQKRSRRQSLVRQVAIAAAVLVLAAGVGVGAWQAVEHLSEGTERVLLIGDPVDPASTPEVLQGPYDYKAPFEAEISSSIHDLKLAEIWEQAAATLEFDPVRARLDYLDITWDRTGTIVGLHIQATTLDGGTVSVSHDLFVRDDGAMDGTLKLEGQILHDFEASSAWLAPELPVPGPVPTVDLVLAEIDAAGLERIVEQAGGQLTPDDAFDPSVIGVEDVTVAEHRAVWSFTNTGPFEAAVTTGAVDPESLRDYVGEYGSYLRLVDGTVETAADLAGLAGPAASAQGFQLEQAWFWTAAREPIPEGITDYETTLGGTQEFGLATAYVLVAPSEPGQDAGRTVAAHPVDAGLEALAFVGDYGHPFWVRNGVVEEIAGETCRTGVSYSLGREWLLYGPLEPYVPCENRAVSVADPGETRSLPSHEASNSIVNMRYDERTEQVWFALYEGPYYLGTCSAKESEPIDAYQLPESVEEAARTPTKIPLDHAFRGDYALSPDASTIVYLGAWENPLRAYLWTAESETELPPDLEALDTPAFSPDGNKICFVGSEEVAGETSLWIYDREAGDWTQLEATECLTPTYPAFSPDGQRIAFRNWTLGDVWTVEVESGELTRYDLSVADMPIAW